MSAAGAKISIVATVVAICLVGLVCKGINLSRAKVKKMLNFKESKTVTPLARPGEKAHRFDYFFSWLNEAAMSCTVSLTVNTRKRIVYLSMWRNNSTIKLLGTYALSKMLEEIRISHDIRELDNSDSNRDDFSSNSDEEENGENVKKNKNWKISVYACGHLRGHSMDGLHKFYEKLGFRLSSHTSAFDLEEGAEMEANFFTAYHRVRQQAQKCPLFDHHGYNYPSQFVWSLTK